MGQRLLINWVYYHPIGHAVEAYRVAQAFRNSNPDLEIAVALNARTALELAPCVPAVDTVYAIDVDDVASPAGAREAIAAVPRDWEYVYADPRQRAPMSSDALDRTAQAVMILRRSAGCAAKRRLGLVLRDVTPGRFSGRCA